MLEVALQAVVLVQAQIVEVELLEVFYLWIGDMLASCVLCFHRNDKQTEDNLLVYVLSGHRRYMSMVILGSLGICVHVAHNWNKLEGKVLLQSLLVEQEELFVVKTEDKILVVFSGWYLAALDVPYVVLHPDYRIGILIPDLNFLLFVF